MKNLFFILALVFFLPAQINGQIPPTYEPTFIGQWTYDIGYNDRVQGTCKTNDGLVISGFTTDSSFSITNGFIMKVNNQGVRQWTWLGPEYSTVGGIATLPDNTYIANLNDEQIGKLAKYDSGGNLVWQKPTGLDYGVEISVDYANQRIAIAGAQRDNEVKIFDFSGNPVDSILLDSKYYSKRSISLRGNYFLISGVFYDNIGWNNEGYVALYKKEAGNWLKQWEDTFVDGHWAQSLFDNTMNIYASDYSLSLNYFITKKYNLAGEIIWEKTLSEQTSTTTCISLLPNQLGVAVLAGTDHNDGSMINVFAYDTVGSPLFSFTYPDYFVGPDELIFDYMNALCVIGDLYTDYPASDIFVARWAIDGITSVEPQLGVIPTDYVLYQNYPNPFNPKTTIRFSLPQGEDVTITVFTSLGQEVKTLVDEYLPAGTYTTEFSGQGLASGIYFYQIRAGMFFQTKKMTLMK